MLSSYTPYVISQMAARREGTPRRAMTQSRRRAARRTPKFPGRSELTTDHE